MHWVLTIFLSVLAVELCLRLPLLAPALRIAALSRKAMAVMRAHAVSDHWKEKALLAYSGALLAQTMRAALALAALCTILALIVAAADSLGAGLGGFLLSWTGLLLPVVAALVYIKIRSRIV